MVPLLLRITSEAFCRPLCAAATKPVTTTLVPERLAVDSTTTALTTVLVAVLAAVKAPSASVLMTVPLKVAARTARTVSDQEPSALTTAVPTVRTPLVAASVSVTSTGVPAVVPPRRLTDPVTTSDLPATTVLGAVIVTTGRAAGVAVVPAEAGLVPPELLAITVKT